MFFCNSLAFSMIQRRLAIWSLIPPPFSKSSLNIWMFMVHIFLKRCLENFEHYFTSVWDEGNSAVVWAFFGNGMKTDLFQSCGHFWVFQICWHIEWSTFTASSFRIWNSSTGVPSPPPALFVVCFLRPTCLHIPECLAPGQWSHHRDYLGCEDLFCTVLLCSLATSS